jgi:hypothetical protein
MVESQINEEKRLNLAKKLFSELLDKKEEYPLEVVNELNADLQFCEEELSDVKPISEDVQDGKYKVELIYDIWTPSGKNEATQKQIDDWKENKSLFVDDDKCFVYVKGVKNIEIMKNETLYVFLKYLLKNKGSAKPIDIYEYSIKVREIYKDIIEDEVDFKNIISSQKRRLLKLFKNKARIKWRFGKYHLENYYLDERKYLEEPLDFILAKEKLRL